MNSPIAKRIDLIGNLREAKMVPLVTLNCAVQALQEKIARDVWA